MYAAETLCQAFYSKTKEPCREWARHRESLNNDDDHDNHDDHNNHNDDDDHEGRLLCGIHSKKGKRTDLPDNPKKDEIRLALVAQRVVEADTQAVNNRLLGRSGSVTTGSFRGMRREYSFVPMRGRLPIFPNFYQKHGFGYGRDWSMFSPMALGPVRHRQPSLPNARNIENYWQFNKVFPNELSNELCDCALAAHQPHFKPAAEFYSRQATAYLDAVPHRHKFSTAKLKAVNKSFVKPVVGKRKRGAGKVSPNINKPMYIVHETPNGEERHYTYEQARVFYTMQMETVIQETRMQEWASLQDLIVRGYDIQIVGYDAYVPRGTDPDSLYEHYLDGSRPFGHEMVILAMLCIPQVEQRPWHRYYREHRELYE